MAHNLELQGSTYHVRLAIPPDVRKAFGGRRILSQSLKTGVHREAMELRLPILATWKAQIKLARQKNSLPEGWQDKVQKTVAELEEFKRNRKLKIIGEPHPPINVSAAEVEAFEKKYPGIVKRLEKLVEQEFPNGIAGDLRIQNMLHEAAKFSLFLDLDTKYKLQPDQKKELDEILSSPQTYKPKSPITRSRLAAFNAFRDSRKIAKKTIDQQDSKLKKLSDYLTETGKPLDFDSVSAWIDSLKLSSKTLAQYLLSGSVFWKWAMKYDERWRVDHKGKANPFEGHDLPVVRGTARVIAQRRDFSMTEIKMIHSAAVKSNQSTLADIILLGTYTGARIEEICKIQKRDLITIDGVESIDITDSKTAAGVRVVPIHPAIKEVVSGLIERSTDEFLIPSSSRSKYGIRSDPFVKSFGRLKTSLGFGPDRVFHSIRKTVITQLIRAGVPGVLVAELVGHETGTVTFDVYSQGASINQKLDALLKLPALS